MYKKIENKFINTKLGEYEYKKIKYKTASFWLNIKGNRKYEE